MLFTFVAAGGNFVLRPEGKTFNSLSTLQFQIGDRVTVYPQDGSARWRFTIGEHRRESTVSADAFRRVSVNSCTSKNRDVAVRLLLEGKGL